ncbi:hypothetical protein C1878_15435 [Gordonibacter sp. 28C]|nr:hypothetical protein C1878_15435 [Gordonibacter sp. 28C]
MHYAWKVLIGLCFLGVGGFPLIFNLVGVYMVPVSTAMGMDMGSFAMFLTIEAVVALFVIPIGGRLFKTKHVSLVMTAGIICCVIGVLGFTMASQPWHMYVIGAILGLGCPFIFGLPQTVLIGNWFGKKYQGRMMSICMACLVASPIFWAPIFTMILNTFGYHVTYIINAALIAILCLPWAIFVFRRAPEDMGMEPYGVNEEAGGKSALEEENDLKVGITPGAAMKTLPFWAILLAACLICFAMGYQNYSVLLAGSYLPSLGEAGAAMFGATMISTFSIGSLCATFLFGFLLDKGWFKQTFVLFLALFVIGMVCWFTLHNEIGLLVGAFCLGTHNGLATVGFPLALRRLFGGKHYSVTYSYVNMCSSTVGGFSSSILGFIFAAVGGIQGMLVFGIGLAIVIAICALIGVSFIGKIPWPEDSKAAEA